jgi:hypothetical protein
MSGGGNKEVELTFVFKTKNMQTITEELPEAIEKKTEPQLKLIKKNLVRLEKLFKAAAKATAAETARLKQLAKTTKSLSTQSKKAESAFGALGKAIFNTGRMMGFTGFVLDVTFTRLIHMMDGFIKQGVGVIQSISNTDAGFQGLEQTVTALARAGLIDSTDVEELVGEYLEYQYAIDALRGEFARLDAALVPVKTALIEIATDALVKINDRLDEMTDAEWAEIIDGIRDAGTAFVDHIIPAIDRLITELPNLADSFEDIGDILGSWAEGRLESMVTMVKTIDDFTGTEWFAFLDETALWLGEYGPMLQTLGKSLALGGAPTQSTGMFMQGLNTVFETGQKLVVGKVLQSAWQVLSGKATLSTVLQGGAQQVAPGGAQTLAAKAAEIEAQLAAEAAAGTSGTIGGFTAQMTSGILGPLALVFSNLIAEKTIRGATDPLNRILYGGARADEMLSEKQTVLDASAAIEAEDWDTYVWGPIGSMVETWDREWANFWRVVAPGEYGYLNRQGTEHTDPIQRGAGQINVVMNVNGSVDLSAVPALGAEFADQYVDISQRSGVIPP